MRALHRWLAFIVTIQVLLVAVTGIGLLFRESLDVALNPDLYRTTAAAEAVPLETIRATVAEAYSKPVQAVSFADGGRPVVVTLGGKTRQQVFVDPGSGTILGTREAGTGAVSVILDLHRRIAVGRVGDVVMGLSGVCLLIVLLTGIWLLIKSARRWNFAIRNTSQAVRIYDLHRLVGAIALPIGLLISITGVLMAYPAVVRAFTPPAQGDEAAMSGTRQGPSDGTERPKREARVTLSWDVLRAAGGPTAVAIQFPRKSGDQITVRLTDGSQRWLDPTTGEEVRRQEGRSYQRWLLALHAGEIGGATATVLYVVTALSLITLAITGPWWWWLRRRPHLSASLEKVALEKAS